MTRTACATLLLATATVLVAAAGPAFAGGAQRAPASADDEFEPLPAPRPDDPQELPGVDPSPRQAPEGLEVDPGDRPADASFEVHALAETLRSEYPDAFAGLWLDNEAGTVVVAVVGDGSALLDTARDDFVEPGRLVVEPADYSEAELERAQDELLAVFSELTAQSAFSLGVDVRRNRVAIGAERPDDIDLSAHVSDDVIAMTVIDGGTAPEPLMPEATEEDGLATREAASPTAGSSAVPVVLGVVVLAVCAGTLLLLAWRRRRGPAVP